MAALACGWEGYPRPAWCKADRLVPVATTLLTAGGAVVTRSTLEHVAGVILRLFEQGSAVVVVERVVDEVAGSRRPNQPAILEKPEPSPCDSCVSKFSTSLILPDGTDGLVRLLPDIVAERARFELANGVRPLRHVQCRLQKP